MRLGCDYNRTVSRDERGADKAAEFIQKERVISIELRRVAVAVGLTPMRDRS